MAAPVGQILRETRAERGVELSEVERVTKIRVKFLRAMEENRWDELPGPAYAHGFLSTYARFLGLDEGELLDRYKRTVEREQPVEPIPSTVIHPGSLTRPRSSRPFALLAAGLLALVALGLVIAAVLGGSENGGNGGRGGEKPSRPDVARTTSTPEPAAVAPSTATTTAVGSEVSLELRATDLVWVCLVDDRGRADVNSETLTAGETRGPFEGPAFEATFGNGSVELTVNGVAAKVPALAQPLSYRITPDGARRLDPGSGPSCT